MSSLNGGSPLVSILTLAYNHGRYLRECLEGIVSQKTDFKFELLIHDDASTDNTAAIIREYEQKFPDIIKPIYQTENQYSKGVKIGKTHLYPRAKGKYIAICEGDDFWIDPLKLQKQVDFMEANPEYSMCCTNIYRMEDKTGRKWCRFYKNRVITLNELMYQRNRIATLSVMMRAELAREYNTVNETMPRWPMGDMPMWIWMASKGDIYKLPDVTAVYRILDESASHSSNSDRRFFFRLSQYEIRLYFCSMLKKCSLPIWMEREFFIVKDVLRNRKAHRDKLKFLFSTKWPIRP